ncbi:transferase, Chloramphenicol acetyltransferase-like domain protein [Artemisia annua]|uniref:Transferase, Chloramphenicol acetyltransferase-like domain protein n=1 Tax=Artemisia annua TaxID=35608 RepID=A0A2U1QJS0_ARTAN|nr:transferase, Chloramphenicol acetyltransferase-like domain protein [Artemisia annua]
MRLNSQGLVSTRLSKVQQVLEIIWKALVGVDRAIHNYPRESILLRLVNVRGRMASLIPKILVAIFTVNVPRNLEFLKQPKRCIGSTDEITPLENIGVVLFFSPNTNHDTKFVAQLEKFLEKTLTHLYPLAGRYVDDVQTVECNDEGAQFIYAIVNIKLYEFPGLYEYFKMVDEFIPFSRGTHQFNDPLLAIQVTMFECGGIVVGVRVAHKIADASTLCTFLNEWACISQDENDIGYFGPSFNSSLLFPPRGVRTLPLPPMSDDYVKQVIHSYLRDSIFLQPINLRGKMASSIPKNSCGNLFSICARKSENGETTEELVNLLSNTVKKTINEYSKVYHDSEEVQMMVLNSYLNLANIPESSNAVLLTSWYKFLFYEVNFGLGKPIWVAPGTVLSKNLGCLMDDAQGNGVEAYVFLKIKDVPCFEEALDFNVFGD